MAASLDGREADDETMQWSYAKAQVFLAEMRKSLRDYDTHAYLEG